MGKATSVTYRVHVWTGAPGLYDTRGFRRITNAIAWATLWQEDTMRDNGLHWAMASIAAIGPDGDTRVPRVWERYAILAPGELSATEMFCDDRRHLLAEKPARTAVPIVWRDRSLARAGE